MTATPRLRALALLLGIAAGFGLAVREGHRAAGYEKFSAFKRIYPQISPEASFYPPLAMLENLVLSRWQPGQTVVIIGGNSVLNGVGQDEHELWSLRLQELLGDRYLVLNFALRGAHPAEGAAVVAESLLERGLPVIYVANSANGPVARPYEPAYNYLFWDARSRGALLPNPARTAELDYRFAAAPIATRTQLDAKGLSARLNRDLYFEELWHHVGYRHFFTIWTELTGEHFWWPRYRFADEEQNAPALEQRYRDPLDREMLITRGASATFAETDGAGGWRLTAGPLRQTEVDLEEIFAPAVRPHVLMLLSQSSPYYRDRLTPDERARDAFAFAAYEQVWRKHGIACVTAGTDFTAADYLDRIHLAPSGGRKLAELVAAQIRRLPAP